MARKKSKPPIAKPRKKSKHFSEIEHYINIGFEAKDIPKITNIPRSTVYSVVDKLKKEADINFKELMEKDYLYRYQLNLDNYSKTIQECNQKIVDMNRKYDELERLTLSELENVPDSKHVSKVHFIQTLVSINNNRVGDLARLIQQRDRASEMKAKLYNSGPVVYRINEYVKERGSIDQNLDHPMFSSNEADPKQLKVVEEVVVEEEDIDEISDEDLKVLKEMDEDMK